MVEPVPINEFLAALDRVSKADPTPSEGAPKLLVIVSSLPEEGNVSEWMADELTENIKSAGTVEVARYALPKVRIHACVGCYGGGGRVCMNPCDRNDIESDIYRPDDQMVSLYEQITAADMLVFATDARWGGINHLGQKFLERLKPFANQANMGKPTIKKKAAAVLVAGEGATEVARRVSGVLNTVGFSYGSPGFTAWHVPDHASAETVKSAFDKSKALHDDLRHLASALVGYSKQLRGE